MDEERKTDYVSFETAKLLNEKGFDEEGFLWYAVNEGEIGEYNITDRSRNPERYIPAPSLTAVRRWFNTKHDIYFEVLYDMLDVGSEWCILRIWRRNGRSCEVSYQGVDLNKLYDDAFLYCLKYLI